MSAATPFYYRSNAGRDRARQPSGTRGLAKDRRISTRLRSHHGPDAVDHFVLYLTKPFRVNDVVGGELLTPELSLSASIAFPCSASQDRVLRTATTVQGLPASFNAPQPELNRDAAQSLYACVTSYIGGKQSVRIRVAIVPINLVLSKRNNEKVKVLKVRTVGQN